MDQTTEFRNLMLTLYRRLGAMQRDEICCEGVTVSQCCTLQILLDDGEMTAGELAEALGNDASSVTRAIDVLVRNGSVERVRPEAGDRRRVILRLTKSGRALARKLLACGDQLFEKTLQQFPAAERPVVFRALRTLLDALGCVGESACRSG